MLTKDFVYLTPGGTMLTTSQETETAIAGRIKAGWTDETIKIIEAQPVGDAVWSIGEYNIGGTGPNSGRQISGYFGEVLVREGSEWRLKMLVGNLKPERDVTGMAK